MLSVWAKSTVHQTIQSRKILHQPLLMLTRFDAFTLTDPRHATSYMINCSFIHPSCFSLTFLSPNSRAKISSFNQPSFKNKKRDHRRNETQMVQKWVDEVTEGCVAKDVPFIWKITGADLNHGSCHRNRTTKASGTMYDRMC